MSQKNYKDTLNLPRTDFPMKENLTVREPGTSQNVERDPALRTDPKITAGSAIIRSARRSAFRERRGPHEHGA
jgi:hypothetical protein